MMKKKILIISYSYPPSNAPAAQRPYALAKYLNKEKFEVSVLTCSNQDSSLGFDSSFSIELDDVRLVKLKSIPLKRAREAKKQSQAGKTTTLSHRIKINIINLLNSIILPDTAIFWVFNILFNLVFNPGKYRADIIFSTSPLVSNHLAARLILFVNRKSKFIADFRDFYYIENYQYRKGLTSKIHKFIERATIKRADNVLFISDSMRDIYISNYESFSNKFYSVYNGYDINENANKVKVENSKLRIFYAGSFYDGERSPMPMCMMIERAINNSLITVDEIEIQIAGNLSQKLIEEMKNTLAFQSIKIIGTIPRNEVLMSYCKNHLLWLIVADKVSHYTGVPIKMFEYMAAKRFIVNFSTEKSESNKIIKDTKIGFNFENKTVSDWNDKQFLEIIKLFRESRLNNVPETNIEKYSKKNQILKLESIL